MGFGWRDGLLLGAVVGALGAPAFAAPPSVDAASVALRSGNASNAVALATQALADTALAPRDRARVLVERGLAHEMLVERDGALADFTAAIDAHQLPASEQARALYDRGVTLDELGRTEDAVGDYSAALGLEPRYAAALNNRGNAYRRLGRLDAARADYQASLAAGNAHAEYPQYGLGQIAEAEGRLDAARDRYRAALAADPQFALAAERLAALGEPANITAPIVLRPPAGVVAPSGDVVRLTPPRAGARQVLRPVRLVSVTPGLKPAFSEAGRAPVARMIQLGAWRREADAARAWSLALAATGNLLAGLSPSIVAVDLAGRGRFYRLRTGPLSGSAGASLCAALKARAQACVVVGN